MQAYTEGKVIQVKIKTDSQAITENWVDVANPDFDVPGCYRVKPTPDYRPFRDREECWTEMLKHQPFGWIRWKIAPQNYQQLSIVANVGVDCVTDDAPMSYQEALDAMTFADGTPFGILEED